MEDTAFPAPPPATAVQPDQRKQVRNLVVGMLFGGIIGAALMLTVIVNIPRGSLGIGAVLSLPLIWLLVVLVHELGHLVAGRLAGFRPIAFYVGPLHFDLGKGVRLRLHRAMATVGGLAVCLPARDTTARGYAVLVAGGPLASLALAVAGIAAIDLLPASWRGIAAATALLSAITLVVALAPMRQAGYLSDGAQLLGLARGDQAVLRRLVLSSLVSDSYAGTRPRALDASVLERVRGSGEPVLEAGVLAYEGAIALDHGDQEAARRAYLALARLLNDTPAELMPLPSRRAYALSVASWLGLGERDAAAARAWLEFSRGGFGDAATLAFVEAVVAVAEGDADAARTRVAAARAALPRHPDRGAAVAMGEKLDSLAGQLAGA